jgi:lipopolysaccharide/colanic/teichoic acid biosynthesis glycosyltransferase
LGDEGPGVIHPSTDRTKKVPGAGVIEVSMSTLEHIYDHSLPRGSVAAPVPGSECRDDMLRVGADFALAAILMVVAIPIILVLMVLIRLSSRGPALYGQRRLGLRGRVYTIYKLRTMVVDCERESGPRWTTPDDPRVTRLGRVLRDLHLDELPQLWNVLRGEMSLVGPRPERPEFAAVLEKTIPKYRARLRVRPGITGLAQVQLPPDTHLDEVWKKVACDLLYIESRTPWLDARIVLATALKLFGVRPSRRCQLLRLPRVKEMPAWMCHHVQSA